MSNRHLVLTKSNISIPVDELMRQAKGWYLDGEYRQFSQGTVALRRVILTKFFWYLTHKQITSVSSLEIKGFLVYMGQDHTDEGGRWGNSRFVGKVRPRTVQLYYANLKTFFLFLVKEGVIDSSPMQGIENPTYRPDQIQPFSPKQLEALLIAAKKSRHPKRDEAILLVLLDTGMRASELCTLRRKNLDIDSKKITVLGKGNRHRAVYVSVTTMKALWKYLSMEPTTDEDPLFLSDGGVTPGDFLTRNGLLQLIRRLGKAAKVEAMRCSPHTFRHTFAIEYLRGGGDVFSLQRLLGHSSLKMTNRYVALADADIENKHRQFSPVDRLKDKRN